MTKNDIIKRLTVLGNELERTVSVSGTKEELEMRLRELEDEYAAIHDGENDTPLSTDSNNSSISTETDNRDAVSSETVLIETPSVATASLPERVTVTALKTLHIAGWHEDREERVEFVSSNTVFRVLADEVDALRAAGLVE